jgi:hypothetical protein
MAKTLAFGMILADGAKMDTALTLPKYTVSQGIRLLYLLRHGFSDTDIAADIKATPAQVAAWIIQYKLDVYRTQAKDQAEINTRAAALREEWRDKVATESKAISVDALALVRETVADGDPRRFNDAARGLSTMVQLARQAEGMDNGAKTQDGAQTLNVWVLRVGEGGVEEARPKVERNVTPDPDDIAF